MEPQSTGKPILAAVVALIVGLVVGYLVGAQSGKQSAAGTIKNLESSLNTFVPSLPDTVNVIGGKITAVNGGSFTIEIPSFTDRYPQPGKPVATETRAIRITADTKITDTSYNPKTFKNGLPQTKAITAADLKTGDVVSVTVLENARTEQMLTATAVSRSSGL